MAKNKKTEPAQPSEEDVLRQRVDAMLDPKRPDPAPLATPTPPASEPQAAAAQTAPAIDIFKEVGTAPEIAPDLLKKIGLKENPEPAVKKKPAPAVEAPPEVAEPPAVPAEIPPAEASAEPAALEEAPEGQTLVDSPETDKAIDDIVVHEADAVLAVEDAAKTQEATAAPPKRPKRSLNVPEFLKKKWLWPLLLVVAAAILLGVPVTRYKLLGFVMTRPVTITVLDTQTKQPVSSADVTLEGQEAKTNGSGVANFKSKPGPGDLNVTKQYYQTYQSKQFVGLTGTVKVSVSLKATGRQVPVMVTDKISGKPIAGAQIDVRNTTAKTNAKGQAFLVLPPTAASDEATITAPGYNLAKASLQVNEATANNFSMVPSGTVYFLSNQSGNIDVVKAALDGSDRHVVLTGTGREDPRTTSLLASRDWRFLVLKAQRDSAETALYLIDTKTDKLNKIDTSNADYQLVGWYNHNFVYDSVSNDKNRAQAGRETLKGYNADGDSLVTLDQNQAEGSSTSYAYQSFYNFYLLNNLVVYNTQWYTYDASGHGVDLSIKTASIRGVAPDNQGKKDYQTFPNNGLSYIQAALYEPQGVYYGVYNSNDNKLTYYKFEDGTVSTATTVDQNAFTKTYPTYLVSPSGKQTFWSDLRDGKNALFVGDTDAKNANQIATLSDYAPYGWFSDNYLLVSKNSSELYILPVSGLKPGQQPLKLTDYYKPAQSYTGYGYGYGGL